MGSAALANPTHIWRQVVTGTAAILLIATLFVVSQRPSSRSAAGFAVTGWLYDVQRRSQRPRASCDRAGIVGLVVLRVDLSPALEERFVLVAGEG